MSRETILKAKAETEEMTTRGREKGTAHPWRKCQAHNEAV